MTFLRSALLYSFLLGLLACGSNDSGVSPNDSTDDKEPATDDGSDDGSDDGRDDGQTPPTRAEDAGTKPPKTAKDAGTTVTPTVKDSGSPTSPPTEDAGATVKKDSGVDAGVKDAGGGLMLPNLDGILSPPDAGPKPPATTGDGGMGKPGAKDGPCKDLMLFCFDAIDMFLFNPDCFTCNGGKGCQACNIPYAI